MNARWIVVGAAVAMTVGGIAAAVPASAATASTCTSYANVHLKSSADEFAQIPIDSSGSFNCYLSDGDSGSGVSRLQNDLNRCFHQDLTIDGDFGYYTHHALWLVQDGYMGPASADGEYGPATRNGILWFASDLTCNPISAYVGF